MVPPSSPQKPLKLSCRETQSVDTKTIQLEEVMTLLKQKRNGVFVEAGAFDGERLSNTLHLEARHGWTGLLVEADANFFLQMLSRNRNAFMINAALSITGITDKPSFLRFDAHAVMGGRLAAASADIKPELPVTPIMVPCFPLHTMLLALNYTNVDFFRLDVEGAKMDILKTVPWNKVNITTLAVEYKFFTPKEKVSDLMKSYGYKLHKDIVNHTPPNYADDFIFVKE
jgi:hypothetical protein